MAVNIFNTIHELIDATASHFIEVGQAAIDQRGRFNVVLSGGPTPELLYKKLASSPFKNQLEWDKVFFFFEDERYVPEDHPEYNGKMVAEAMFNPLNVLTSNIFLVDTSLTPHLAAKEYENTILQHFNWGEIKFDLVILGLGEDAHTASLFPYSTILGDRTSSIQEVYAKEKEAFRISMTAPMINDAQNLTFLVAGEETSDAVYNVLEGERNPTKYPSQLIKPINGNLNWYIDSEAASKLNKKA